MHLDLPTAKLVTGIAADILSAVVSLAAIWHIRKYLAAQVKKIV